MMRVVALDRWASGGTSWLHCASPPAKWLLLGAAVLLAIGAHHPWPVLAGYALLVLAIASCRLPVAPLVVASLLPVPMFGLFALSRWNGSFTTPLLIIGKGMVTAVAGLLVAATTPYPDLLAPATRVLPHLIGDSLVLTYRALFILAAQVEALWLAIRARGGFFSRPAAAVLPWPAQGTSWRRRFDVASVGMALVLLRGVDLSTRLYDVMRLRGYQGKLSPTRSMALRRSDWQPLLLGLVLVGLAAASRAGNR